MSELPELLFQIFIQSLMAVGGIYVVLAEFHRVVVLEHGWITDAEFTMLFALAQASPGPNMLVVPLVAWRIAGVPGAILATAVFVLPSFVMTGFVAQGMNSWMNTKLFLLIRRSLVPVTVGLVSSSAVLLINGAAQSYGLLAISLASAVLSLTTKLHPVAVLAGAACLGLFGVST